MDTKASIKAGQVWEPRGRGTIVRVEQNNGGLIMVRNILTGHGTLFGWKTFLQRHVPSVVLG